ncbi:molybdenum ABC transporter ATP-binding protein [Pontibaca salina]|uniref:Molybdenum ABC transporter ATP-binding protein n=1 Tax=Pontibaca salina TaxID=2795731 RepID=A0A934HQM1_9RHOB|nr:molybdenum ABC transporter ATP-binding protein [Pontibaca salina]MBI6629927.1 molybdenum ABC transporter ATP-binding protein [Pontibaca salina]
MTLSVSLTHRLGQFDLDVSFEAPAGLTVLFGQSGSGKTTVINAVAGLLKAQAGRIALDDWVLEDSAQRLWLPPHRRKLGYIFQESRLFPHFTVRQNLRYASWFARRDGPGESLSRVVEMLGIGHLLDRRPALLSGGEKQRVAIGRALLAAPRLILADEPLAALDEARKAEIMPYFERLRDEVAVPILYVSHSPAEVVRLATTVVALQNGRVARVGSPAEVFGDPTIAPAGVRGIGAVLEARVVARHADGLSELAAGAARLFLAGVDLAPGKPLRVRIAAHDVMLSLQRPEGVSALNILSGHVEAVRLGDGPAAIISVQTSAGRLLSHVTQRSVAALGLKPGVACHAIIKTLAIASRGGNGTATTQFQAMT